MSSNFIKNSKPKTKSSRSHQTHDYLSLIKPRGKSRQRRPIVDHPTSVEKTLLKKITATNDDELIGMFLERDCGVGCVGMKKYVTEDGKCIDHFKTLDSMEEKHILAYDESDKSLRIFAKVSR